MRPEEGSLSSPDLSEGSLPLIHNLPPTLFQEKGRPRVHFSELRDGAVLDVKINAFMNVCSDPGTKEFFLHPLWLACIGM